MNTQSNPVRYLLLIHLLKRSSLACILFVFLLLGTTGCDSTDNASKGTDEVKYSQMKKALTDLDTVDSCPKLLESMKKRAISEMEAQIDANMQRILEYGVYCYPIYYENDADSSPGANGSIKAGGTDQASDYSTTNVQVAGVDEADFIKNDGAYIYILTDDKFKIIDAWPPEEAHIISEIPLEGTPKKLFVTADRALIYSSHEHIGYEYPHPMGYTIDFPERDECTYGYNCDFTGDDRKLQIAIYDITDRSQPVLTRKIEFTGSYINSRRINTAVHTVIFFPEIIIPGVEYWPEFKYDCDTTNKSPSREEIISSFEALKEKNRVLIQSTDLSDWLPSMKDTAYIDGQPVENENIFLDCSKFLESGRPEGQAFLSIVSFNIDQLSGMEQTTILGNPGAVYASSENLYISVRQKYNTSYPWYFKDVQQTEASTIHKFRLENEPAQSEYAGSGVVKGRVLNQFAMDEYEGFLRIATTTGHVPSPDVHSTLSVFEEDSNELKLTGQIDQIAPTEDIRSVRFYGDKAFIVTFKKTDPLFAFDLSIPANPKIIGELKIPGYSTYMHLMDDSHLLTIGYDADDQGSFAWFEGILLQIFDVSDMSRPSLTHKAVIGTRGSSSEAATNHLAFNYFPSKDLLAIPMTICEDSTGGGSYGQSMTFSGLLVYDVTTQDGFVEKGRVSHADAGEVSCSNWWTDSNSLVKRSIFMDDYVFSVALDQIIIQKLESLGTNLNVINLDN